MVFSISMYEFLHRKSQRFAFFGGDLALPEVTLGLGDLVVPSVTYFPEFQTSAYAQAA